MKLSDDELYDLLKEEAIDELSMVSTIQSHLLKGAKLSITGVVYVQLHLPFYGKESGLDVNIKANLSPRGNGPYSTAKVSADGCVLVDKKTGDVKKLTLTTVRVSE